MMAPAMPVPPAFAPLAHDLRDEVIEHYERRGERLDTPAGLRTLDTNSILAPDRARLLLRLLAQEGAGPIAGRRVLDLGAGFGALSLYFAHLGAEVVAADPNEQRMQVALAIAERHGLALSIAATSAQALPFPSQSFDFVLANNSLCYIVDRATRRQALAEILRVLCPGGWLAMRNPNRLHPRDQFTGLPLLPLLGPALADRAARALGRHRSQVRLTSPPGALLELRRAGFGKVCFRAGGHRRATAPIAGYHHVLARRRLAPGSQAPAAASAALQC
jgi:SAM-dependent methyltransferase